MAALLPGALPPVQAQSANFNQRDDQYVLLGLKRAKESFELAGASYARQQDLFGRGLLSQSQLDNARQVLSEAEVNEKRGRVNFMER